MEGIYVGLDLSLTGTGVAILSPGERVTRTVSSKGKTEDPLIVRYVRLHTLAKKIVDMIPDEAKIAIETPAHNQRSGHHHDRSGLWWMVLDMIYDRHTMRVVEVSTTTVKKYATGKGNASKMEVMAQQIRQFPELPIANDNEADALTLALIVARLNSEPYEASLPQVNLSAMAVLSQSETAS